MKKKSMMKPPNPSRKTLIMRNPLKKRKMVTVMRMTKQTLKARLNTQKAGKK